MIPLDAKTVRLIQDAIDMLQNPEAGKLTELPTGPHGETPMTVKELATLLNTSEFIARIAMKEAGYSEVTVVPRDYDDYLVWLDSITKDEMAQRAIITNQLDQLPNALRKKLELKMRDPIAKTGGERVARHRKRLRKIKGSYQGPAPTDKPFKSYRKPRPQPEGKSLNDFVIVRGGLP